MFGGILSKFGISSGVESLVGAKVEFHSARTSSYISAMATL